MQSSEVEEREFLFLVFVLFGFAFRIERPAHVLLADRITEAGEKLINGACC